MASTPYTWCWAKDGGMWSPYPRETQSAIENAYRQYDGGFGPNQLSIWAYGDQPLKINIIFKAGHGRKGTQDGNMKDVVAFEGGPGNWMYDVNGNWMDFTPGINNQLEECFWTKIGCPEVELDGIIYMCDPTHCTVRSDSLNETKKMQRVLAPPLYDYYDKESVIRFTEHSGIRWLRSEKIKDLVELCKSTTDAVRHQNLSDEFFVPTDELQSRMLRTISHPWLAKQHPDPNCEHLQWIKEQPWCKEDLKVGDHLDAPYRGVLCYPATIKEFNADGTVTVDWDDGGTEYRRFAKQSLMSAVFVDFCCVPQEGPDGKKRTDEEEQRFEKAISNMELLYASSLTYTDLLDNPIPKEAEVQHEYEDRGWCFFESEASMLKQFSANRTSARGEGGGVLVPLRPDDFDNQLAEKHFTNAHTDRKLVAALYIRLFNVTVRQANKLVFKHVAPGAESADRWEKLLHEASTLQELTFVNAPATHLELLIIGLQDPEAMPELKYIDVTMGSDITEEAAEKVQARMITVLRGRGFTELKKEEFVLSMTKV